MTQADDLGRRFAAIEDRLCRAEVAVAQHDGTAAAALSSGVVALQDRYAAMQSRLAAIEQQLGISAAPQLRSEPASSSGAVASASTAAEVQNVLLLSSLMHPHG